MSWLPRPFQGARVNAHRRTGANKQQRARDCIGNIVMAAGRVIDASRPPRDVRRSRPQSWLMRRWLSSSEQRACVEQRQRLGIDLALWLRSSARR